MALLSLLEYLSPAARIQSQPAAPEADDRHVLVTPENYKVKELYIGSTHEHLVANAGDSVIVHAWIDGNAIAYNPRNLTAGQIPKSFLAEKGITVAEQPEIAVLYGYSSKNVAEWIQ